MQAQELLTRVLATYATLQTYTDTGTVTTQFLSSTNGNCLRTAHFSTYFDRPNRFRLDYVEAVPDPPDDPWPRSRFQICRKGSFASVIEHDEVEEMSLKLAIAKFTGVSHCVSHTIPRLLMPAEVIGRRLVDWMRKWD